MSKSDAPCHQSSTLVSQTSRKLLMGTVTQGRVPSGMAPRVETARAVITSLSRATCIDDFVKYQLSFDTVRTKIASLVQQRDGLRRLLSDGSFVKLLYTAASRGLSAICQSLDAAGSVTPTTSSCMASFFAIFEVILAKSVMATDTGTSAPEGTRGAHLAPAAASALLTDALTIVKTTEILQNLARACLALAAAINRFLQSKHIGPDYAAAAATADKIKATSSLAKELLSFWAGQAAMWGCAAADHSDTQSLGGGLFNWSEPELRVTIQPSFSLITAMLKLEAKETGPGRRTTSVTLDSKSGLLSSSQYLIWDAVTTANAFISTAALDRMQATHQDMSDEMTQFISILDKITLSPDIQQLQLFILAALAGGLHQQHKGVSPVKLQGLIAAECASDSNTCNSDDDSAAADSRKGARDSEQQLLVADCTPQLLQQLGLRVQQGQQLFNLLAAGRRSGGIAGTVVSATLLLSRGSIDRLFGSADAKVLPILKMKLMIQLMLLSGTPSLLPGALTYLPYAGLQWIGNHMQDGPKWESRRAVAAVVADSILAPMVSDFGPVLLQLQPASLQTLQWATAVQHFWTFFCHHTSPDSAERCYKEPSTNLWATFYKKRPLTAAASLEAIIRAVTTAPRPGKSQLPQKVLNVQALSCVCTMDMVFLFMCELPESNVLSEVAVHAARVPNSSSSSRWLTFSNKTPAARFTSLLISSLKFVLHFLPLSAGYHTLSEKKNALKVAMSAYNAAMWLAGAGSRGFTAVAVPSLHVAARALHAFASVVLCQSGRAGLPAGDNDLSSDVLTFLGHMWHPLEVKTTWCQQQIALLESSEEDSSSSPAKAHRSTVLEEILQQLQQQFQQLQEGLTSAQQCWSAYQGVCSQKMAYQKKCKDSFKVAKQLQQYSASLAALLPTTLCCNNPSCGSMTDVSELACVGRRKCSRCQAAGYCSRECQTEHWGQHKKMCSWLCQAHSTSKAGA